MLPLLLALVTLGAARQSVSVAETTHREVAAASNSAGELQIQLGLHEYWRLRFPAAAGRFEDAIRADPESAAAYYYLAYTVYKIAEPKAPDDPGKHRAQTLFAKAFALDPHFVPAWR